jgi:hypothetical protein
MPVRITKPEINLREIINELDKQTGVAGEAMLRAETPQEQFNLIGAGRRNLVMNGGFDVWQRGTTVTTASNSYTSNFTADRWSAYFAGTYTQQQTTLPNGDYVNYFRGVLGTTGSNRININHFIENGNSIMSGKYITVSFWLKASVIDSQVNVKIQTTSGSTFSSYTIIANKYIETSLDWKKYEITLKCNNDIANIGARAHGILEIDGVDGSWANGTTFEIAQVQMELGKVATPFEHRSYGEELAACQRYYVQYDLASYQRLVATSYCDINNRTQVDISLPVPLRSYVSAGHTNLTISGQAVNGINLSQTGSNGNILTGNLTCPGTPLSVGTVYQVYAIGTGNFYVNGEL